MQHRAVVARIFVVPVIGPPARGAVDLHVAVPVDAIETKVGLAEVRSAVGVETAGIEHRKGPVIGGRKTAAAEALLAPEVMQKGFRHGASARRRFAQEAFERFFASEIAAAGRKIGVRRSSHGRSGQMEGKGVRASRRASAFRAAASAKSSPEEA